MPCSGTGTIARNPEIRHRLKPEDFARHHERQVAILNVRYVTRCSKGGRLLYSTCSLEPEENERVIEECLQKGSGFEVMPLELQLDGLVQSGAIDEPNAAVLRNSGFRGPYLRTLPGVHPCDGFFAAMLVRH